MITDLHQGQNLTMTTRYLIFRDIILEHSGLDLLLENLFLNSYFGSSEIDDDCCSNTNVRDTSEPDTSWIESSIVSDINHKAWSITE